MSRPAIVIAVLPFRNLSEETDTGYFARGFVEDLIANLTRFHELRVIAGESAFALQDAETAADTAARTFGVQFLLEGSVRRRGRTVRLTVQLVQAADRQAVWAERFDAPLDDVFAIQDEITATVAGKLAVQVGDARLRRTRRASAAELEVYDLWLRGADYLRRGTEEDDAQAREYFQRAADLDPDYARAWSGLSVSHFNEWTCQAWHLYDESRTNALHYAEKAAAIDDRDAMVQAVLARVLRFREDHAAADRHAARALELNPNDANVLIHVAIARLFGGEPAAAYELAGRATALNPLHGPWYHGVAGWSLFMQDRAAEALPLLERAGTSIVNFGAYRAACHVVLGDDEGARREFAAFVADYRDKIAFGRDPESGEALRWAMQVEPFRDPRDARKLPEALRRAGLCDLDAGAAPADRSGQMVRPAGIARPAGSVFRREGDVWTMDYEEGGARLVEVKGFHDIARLLAEPHVEIHCLELAGAPPDDAARHEVLDPQARREYRGRIAELQAEIERAEADHDLARQQAHRAELDLVLEELQKATGLGGRGRALGDLGERARSAVRWRIRSAIKKIRAAHPRLGQHLDNSIRTGVFCVYAPESPVDWRL